MPELRGRGHSPPLSLQCWLHTDATLACRETMRLVRSLTFNTVLPAVLVSLAVSLLVSWATVDSLPQSTFRDETSSGASRSSTDRLIRTIEARLGPAKADAGFYTLLGSAYVQKAREAGDPSYYPRAEEAFRRALQVDAQHAEAMAGMGALALSRHQFQEALDWGEQARQINPHDAHTYGIIGDAYVELGRYPEAWATFQKMMESRPDLSSYARASYARELTGDIPGAIEAMERALVAGGPNMENTNWSRVQLGDLYLKVRELSKAEGQYRKALALFPGYVYAQAGLARVAVAKGHHEEAIARYKDLVERFPLPEFVIALGDLQAATSHPEEAARLYALVRVQQQLYQANGVNTDLEMALFDADHDQSLDEALAKARQEYHKRPSIWAADVLAWTLYKKSEYQEALRYSTEARRLGTTDAIMLFHAGMTHYALGNRQDARALLEKALSLNPHFSMLYRDQAIHALEELQRVPGYPSSQGR